MTGEDFIWIASMFADAEARIEQQADEGDECTPARLSTLDSIIENFKLQIADQYPRFNAGKFQIDSRPIANARLKARILDSLNKDRTG